MNSTALNDAGSEKNLICDLPDSKYKITHFLMKGIRTV